MSLDELELGTSINRYARRGTLLAVQIPVDHWRDVVGDPTFGDAISAPMDRRSSTLIDILTMVRSWSGMSEVSEQMKKSFTSSQRPWGKSPNQSGQTHYLAHHSADVACCFRALLAEPVLRDRFDRAAGGDLGDLSIERLCVLAFLHDFGKASTGFQFQNSRARRVPAKAGHIEAAIWACNREEVVRGIGLDKLLEWGEPTVQLFLAGLAHHGRPFRKGKLSAEGHASSWRQFDGYNPILAGRQLLDRAREWFRTAFEEGPPLPASPALAHLFAGTLAIADQIGSNEELFPYEPDPNPAYLCRAERRARRAVARLGFSRAQWAHGTTRPDFDTLFPGWSPRSLQNAVATASLGSPLLVLESETGSGKTEAAVWRFARLWCAGLVDGLYFALPTRAAAVQLHERVSRALTKLFPRDSGLGTVLAVPGYLRVGEASGWRVGRYEVAWRDDPKDSERLARWSAESARKFLAAPAAVGTIDQALLGGLQVKWAHFRGSALARSLLVVDEVHASDAYMTEVLRGLLRGHLEIGGHALLMSATLGSEARDGFLHINAGRRRPKAAPAEAEAVKYPILATSGLRGPAHFDPFPADSSRSKTVEVSLRPILREPEAIVALAVSAASQGARVLVVRNTVGSAQAVFRAIRDCGSGDLLLQAAGGPAVHHSRFAAEDRKLLDAAVEKALGKHRSVGGCIAVGTQTLEQSLDIDADFMITDLCPVDVLLQRIGRLHRHGERERPKAFESPRCVVLVPEGGLHSEGLLAHGLGMSKTGGVYRDLRILELTRRLVTDHPVWRIPEMNRMLVERGTHPDNLRAIEDQMGPIGEGKSAEVDGRAAAERQLAFLHALDRSAEFGEMDFPSDEKVRTRLGDDGPRILLAEPAVGPFGEGVTIFNLPAHMFREREKPTHEEIEGAHAETGPEGLVLTVGSFRFEYDRAGVRRMG